MFQNNNHYLKIKNFCINSMNIFLFKKINYKCRLYKNVIIYWTINYICFCFFCSCLEQFSSFDFPEFPLELCDNKEKCKFCFSHKNWEKYFVLLDYLNQNMVENHWCERYQKVFFYQYGFVTQNTIVVVVVVVLVCLHFLSSSFVFALFKDVQRPRDDGDDRNFPGRYWLRWIHLRDHRWLHREFLRVRNQQKRRVRHRDPLRELCSDFHFHQIVHHFHQICHHFQSRHLEINIKVLFWIMIHSHTKIITSSENQATCNHFNNFYTTVTDMLLRLS